MALILEIEHLLGVAFAARNAAASAPDWPPEPDRVFSALVATWALCGERINERRALEWLEAQPTPEIVASGGVARSEASVFVPPNDNEVSDKALSSKWFEFLRHGATPPKKGGYRKEWRAALGVVPSERSRTERRFPAFRPDDPVVQLVWRGIEADGEMLAMLNVLAADTSYIGHSSSLTRCRFRTASAPERATSPRRRVYPGRLAELERSYHAGRRPNSGEDVRAEAAVVRQLRRSVFSDRWLVLEHVEGEMPDLRAAALVAKALRCALMSGYKRIGSEEAIPTIVSGHVEDGSPGVEPHLTIAPLAFLGSQFADGRVFAFALIPPRGSALLEDETFRRALRGAAPWNKQEERRELRLTTHGFDIVLTPTGQRDLRSLDPAPYVAVAKTWATATAVVLDRHLKAKGNAERDAEIRDLLNQACLNIGLPQPAHIAAGKHSAVTGAPSAYPSGHAPRWTGWRLPKSLATRQLTYALLQFSVLWLRVYRCRPTLLPS
jgi:CRISPR-associated protein Csb2